VRRITRNINGRIFTFWVFTDSQGEGLPLATRCYRWSTYPFAGKRGDT
jgi:hypothetical protein